MEYRTLGRAGVKVSPLCLGTMMFGGPTNERDSIRIIHKALDAGINFLDTANVYNDGESERVIGKAIRSNREKWVIATKVHGSMGDDVNAAGSHRFHIMSAVEASLERLGTDHIDVYYLHRWDASTRILESLRALDDCVRQGRSVISLVPIFRRGASVKHSGQAKSMGWKNSHASNRFIIL